MTRYLQKIIAEASYPTTFRKKETSEVLKILSHHQSLTLVGMKRVGVSNFLRYVTFNPKAKQLLTNGGQFVFVYLDSNDVSDITLLDYWMLLLKRMADAAETLPGKQRDQVVAIYSRTTAHNTDKPLMLLEAVREMAAIFVDTQYYLVIVLARFDRLLPLFTEQFFANLESIVDVSQEHISYIFTSYLPFSLLCPEIFFAAKFSMFAKTYYLKPGDSCDLHPIIEAFERQRGVRIPQKVARALMFLTGGHVQLLQLSLIASLEQHTTEKIDVPTLLLTLSSDERIMLQCDEIFESLTEKEQKYLLEKHYKQKNNSLTSAYLVETGIVKDGKTSLAIFSPIFEKYLEAKHKQLSWTKSPYAELTKKETLLLTYLVEHKGDICSRDQIIEAVWPEFEDISDWALDQLVSRVRKKLEIQHSQMKIKTNRGRGYQLIDA